MPEPVVNLDHEVWASLPNYPGYWVSSEGRVRSRRGVLRPSKVNRLGHLKVTLGGRSLLVHRLVAGAFISNPSGLPMVLHGDGHPANNRAENLRWGTGATNMADAQLHGTKPVARHGTRYKYQHGCRCPACTEANTAFDRARRATNPRFVAQQKAAQHRYYARKKETS